MTVTTLTPTSGGPRTAGTTGQMCTFWVDGLYFGLQVEHVQEVLRYQQLTVVPCAPDAVHGLINLRGAVIPVIDMAGRLGMKMTEPSERSAIIVTDIGGKLVGLLVEQVSDMMTIRSEDLQPAPDIIPEEQRSFCRGIVALEKSMVCFLNLDTVIADELAREAA